MSTYGALALAQAMRCGLAAPTWDLTSLHLAPELLDGTFAALAVAGVPPPDRWAHGLRLTDAGTARLLLSLTYKHGLLRMRRAKAHGLTGFLQNSGLTIIGKLAALFAGLCHAVREGAAVQAYEPILLERSLV